MNKEITLFLLYVAGVFILMTTGAILHERDIYSNLRKYGDAKNSAWTCTIYSAEMKDK